ncbi:hypothetical protein SERLADRAFT_476072, partial [Serpula lacrymans var. lacrymans S7.9]
MSLPCASVTTTRILVTVFHACAIMTTTFRLWYRVRKRRFWWDDGLAAIALLSLCISLVCVWIITDGQVSPSGESKMLHITADWGVVTTFTTCLWFARMSIMVSIVRLAPPALRIRYLALCSSVLFALMWVALLVQKLYLCGHNIDWYDSSTAQCRLASSVAILQVVTDVVSDALLVALPIRLLRNVNLPKNQRKLILSVFSSSVLITLVCVIHIIFVIKPAVSLQTITGQLEIALSLIICNLLVIVTYLYGVIRN